MFQNVTIQPSALVGRVVHDGSYGFVQHCDGEKHVVWWNPSTNVFTFDAIGKAEAVFNQMSQKRLCHCEGLLLSLRAFQNPGRAKHVVLGFNAHDDGPGDTFNAALYIAMITN